MRKLQTIRASTLKRHVHKEAYAALVLAGGYEEAGDHGRFRVRAGDVIFHEEFEAHLDRFPDSGAVVLNLRLRRGSFVAGLARAVDGDEVVRVAERSCDDAIELLRTMVIEKEPVPMDWPDELAAALMENPSLRLARWGETQRMAPWVISRGFALVFGVSPEVFRARVRARRALKVIRESEHSMARIAADLGFADQSHMTRSVKQLTGMGPRAWRSANGFKTESGAFL